MTALRFRGIRYWWAGIGISVLAFLYVGPIAAALRQHSFAGPTTPLTALTVPSAALPLLRVPTLHRLAPLPPLHAAKAAGASHTTSPTAVRSRVPVVTDSYSLVGGASGIAPTKTPVDLFQSTPTVSESVGAPVQLPATPAPAAAPTTPAAPAAPADTPSPDTQPAGDATPTDRTAADAPRFLAVENDSTTPADNSTGTQISSSDTSSVSAPQSGTITSGSSDLTTAPPASPVETSVIGGSDTTSVSAPADTSTVTITASTGTDATGSTSLTAPDTTSATEPTGTQSSTSSPSGQSGDGPGAGSTTGVLSLTGNGSGGSGGALAGLTPLTQSDGATAAPGGVVGLLIDPNANTSSGLSPPADWATTTTGSNAHVIALGISGSNYELTVDGTVKTAPIASVSSITITGTPDVDDTLTVDLSGGPILVPISFDGGVAGYDTLIVTGTNADLTSVGTGPNSGTFTVGGTVINYAGLEPVTDTGTPGNVVLTTAATDDQLTLTDVGGGNLKLHSMNASVEDTLFSDASTSVTINLNGGNDTIDVTALGPFAGSLTINGGSGVDTFAIHGLGSYAGAIHLAGGTGNDVFQLGDAFGAVTITDAGASNTLDFTTPRPRREPADGRRLEELHLG